MDPEARIVVKVADKNLRRRLKSWDRKDKVKIWTVLKLERMEVQGSHTWGTLSLRSREIKLPALGDGWFTNGKILEYSLCASSTIFCCCFLVFGHSLFWVYQVFTGQWHCFFSTITINFMISHLLKKLFDIALNCVLYYVDRCMLH